MLASLPGCKPFESGPPTGGVAALNHRLIAVKPPASRPAKPPRSARVSRPDADDVRRGSPDPAETADRRSPHRCRLRRSRATSFGRRRASVRCLVSSVCESRGRPATRCRNRSRFDSRSARQGPRLRRSRATVRRRSCDAIGELSPACVSAAVVGFLDVMPGRRARLLTRRFAASQFWRVSQSRWCDRGMGDSQDVA